jgi:hypothetical protein
MSTAKIIIPQQAQNINYFKNRVVTLLIYPLHHLAQQHVNNKDFISTTSTVNQPV